MRIIAKRTIIRFAERHPLAKPALYRWAGAIEAGEWRSMAELSASFSAAKVLNADRVRFAIGGGAFRLIAGFDFHHQIAFIKFIGTHEDYDRIDALTVAQF